MDPICFRRKSAHDFCRRRFAELSSSRMRGSVGGDVSSMACGANAARDGSQVTMKWLVLSTHEWLRRPLRTTVTVAGVALAVAAVFSLLAFHDGYHDAMRNEIDRLGAHVLVVPKGCPYDATSIALHGASWPCYLKESYFSEVSRTPGVASAAPAFMAAMTRDD